MTLRTLTLATLTLSGFLWLNHNALAQSAPAAEKQAPRCRCACEQETEAPVLTSDEVLVDLRTGQVTGQHSAVRLSQRPADRDRDGYQEAVLAVNLKGYRGLELEAIYDAAPTGFSLNVGDSETNNGYAGDAATQTNDAELEVASDTLRLWGNDTVPTPQRKLAEWKGAIREGTKLTLKITDGEVRWRTDFGDATASGQCSSSGLFALDGQPDREGPVNYDVFLGLNQVVSGGSRRGSGLSKVRVRLVR